VQWGPIEMSETPSELVARAEEWLRQRRFGEAARCFEAAEAAARSKAGRAELLRRGADAYVEERSTSEAGRCFLKASGLLEGKDKADCLMAYWRALVLAIAGDLYDCGFEWKGEPDHHDDHVAYQQSVQKREEEAVRVLSEALRIEGIDRDAIIAEARAECRRREKDGWGAAHCWAIVARAT